MATHRVRRRTSPIDVCLHGSGVSSLARMVSQSFLLRAVRGSRSGLGNKRPQSVIIRQDEHHFFFCPSFSLLPGPASAGMSVDGALYAVGDTMQARANTPHHLLVRMVVSAGASTVLPGATPPKRRLSSPHFRLRPTPLDGSTPSLNASPLLSAWLGMAPGAASPAPRHDTLKHHPFRSSRHPTAGVPDLIIHLHSDVCHTSSIKTSTTTPGSWHTAVPS
ncbi:hypothetical protein B0T11DRAFT_143979 [Plectosphaerella cucumerina]|uniref:Uncharacterized protein n=1 Tax=Plectosphaerella cucumerina TaxID=40658 RepID=A0A8K0WY33_9PEZI|nr:hypothetical protein B0T11DRAFT_143979 [Plectosphaerella cucumerina]